MRIINKMSGKAIAEITTNHSMTLDDAINLVGEIHPEETDENVKIGENWYYYDDLELEY